MLYNIARNYFVKKAASHSIVLILSFLFIGSIEFYNNILFKLLDAKILHHKMMSSLLPILFLFMLKSLDYVGLFLLILVAVAIVYLLFRAISARRKQANSLQDKIFAWLSLFFDLLVPVLMIYLLLFEYDASPFTLTYYFYFLSDKVSPLLKNMMTYKTLTQIVDIATVLVIAGFFIRFRLSVHQQKIISSLSFAIILAVIPGLVFLIHCSGTVLVKSALLLVIVLLLAYLVSLSIRLLKSDRYRLSGVFLIVLLLATVSGNIYFYTMTRNSRLNVVFIVLDTLRQQSFEKRTMPFLYSLKDRGVYFPNSYSSSDNTVTSHNAIYYGKYPSIVGMEKGPFPSTTIMEVLRSHNYHTAVVSANGRFCIVNGFDKGVDDFYEAWRKENHIRNVQITTDYHPVNRFHIIEKYLNYYERAILNRVEPIDKNGLRPNEYRYYNYEPARVINEFIKNVIRKNPPSQPFCLFVNYLDPHTPYLSPEPQRIERVVQKLKTSLPDIYEKLDFAHLSVSDTTIYQRIMLMWKEVDRLTDKATKDEFLTFCYEENINYLDEQMSELFDFFDQIRLRRNTLVVITSDHGESIGEHDLYEHGNKRLYNQEIQVPLFFLFPENLKALSEGKVIATNTESVDLFSTLVDFLGIKSELRLNGESLLSYIFAADESDDFGYSISEYTGVSAITDHTHKLILTDKTTELYDLAEDPEEKNNLAGTMPTTVAELKKTLSELRNTSRSIPSQFSRAVSPQREYDAETLEQLKTLGYIK